MSGPRTVPSFVHVHVHGCLHSASLPSQREWYPVSVTFGSWATVLSFEADRC